MPAETQLAPAGRARTPRQEDGAIYKVMAFVAFAFVALPLGYAASNGLSPAGRLSFALVGCLAFDAGWDLTLRAMGRRDMLLVEAPRLILGRALERAVVVGLVLLCLELPSEMRIVAIALVVMWSCAELLLHGRAGASGD